MIDTEYSVLTIPLGPHLAPDTLRKALDRKFGSVIVGIAREGYEPAHGGNLYYKTPLLTTIPSIVLTHNAHRMKGHSSRAPEVGVHYATGLGVFFV